MRVLAAASVAAFLICGAAHAESRDSGHAGDAASKPAAPLWAGVYGGVHFGRAWGDSSAVDFGAAVADGAFACASALTPYCGSPFEYQPSGWVSGAQLGYNWLRGSFLFGIEGDFGRLDVNDEAIRDRGVDQDIASIDYGWYSALTGRIGVPLDRTLLYLKGGAAFAEIKTLASDRDEAFSTGSGLWYLDPLSTVRDHGIDAGWTLGGGLEYAFGASWSFKAEYLYMNFGSSILTDIDGDRYKLQNDLHTVKLGLNYHPYASEQADAVGGDDASDAAVNWDGRYIGVHVAWARTDTSSVDFGTPPGNGGFACVPGNYCGSPFNIDAGGWITGIQAGQNWQRGGIVFGFEGDLGRIDLQKDDVLQRSATDRDQASVDYGWYGATTARLGLPFRRAMLYVKGGLALAEITNAAADLDSTTVPAGAVFFVDPHSATRTHRIEAGWTLGGGVEYALDQDWRLKAEYLYMDFGSEISADPDGDLYKHENALHVVKLGLNYNLTPSDPPLPLK